MFSKSFLVLCLVPFIWCELTRNDINISSASIAGGIIPSKSIILSTSTGTKFSPKTGDHVKSQNVTLKTPLLSVSVKNTTSVSGTDTGAKITNTLTELVDNSNQDLLLPALAPERMINPEDIMLDLNVPMRVTELEDLTKASSVDQFKQKILHSSLIEKLFAGIEDNANYYPALENLASTFRPKRSKRSTFYEKLNPKRRESFNLTLANKYLNRTGNYSPISHHRIFYHYPKKSNSEIVFKPEIPRVQIKRSVNPAIFFNPSIPSNTVDSARAHLPPPPRPLLPFPFPLLAPMRNHHPVHHLPRIPPIPPNVLHQIIRARVHHPLPPPPIPLGLLLPIARSIGILPSQILSSLFNSYHEDVPEIIIARGKPLSQDNSVRKMVPIHSVPIGSSFLRQPMNSMNPTQLRYPYESPESKYYAITQQRAVVPGVPAQSTPLYRYTNHRIFDPSQRNGWYLTNRRSIFENLPTIQRSSDNQYNTMNSQPVHFVNLPSQQNRPTVNFAHTSHQPHVNNIMNHRQFPMPASNFRIPHVVPNRMNDADSQEVFESLEHSGALFGNALFSLLRRVPSVTR